MPKRIVILEDNEDRRTAMQACLAEEVPSLEATFFDDAREMIAFLENSLDGIMLLSLDNDLELKPDRQGKLIDPGSGCEVADYLARKSPSCPVIIATTNSTAAAGIKKVLRRSGWKTYSVIPFDDVKWIHTEWSRLVRKSTLSQGTRKQGVDHDKCM